MRRSTRWMISFVYYVSQLFGVVTFSYNFETGKLETNVFMLTYSCLVSVGLVFSMLQLFFQINYNFVGDTPGLQLHNIISILLWLIHMGCSLITIVLNWSKRKHFMNLIRDFQCFKWNFLQKFKMSTKVLQYYENSIRTKFCWGLAADIIAIVSYIHMLQNIINILTPLTTLAMSITVCILELIVAHYFFALLNINCLLAVVNEELGKILNSSWNMFQLQRLKKIKMGALTVASCELSDTLDALAMTHYNLQNLGERTNRFYEMYAAFMILGLYLNNISTIYLVYMLLRHEELSQQFNVVAIVVLTSIELLVFYKDMSIFITNMLHFGDFIEKTAILLNFYQSWLPTLDERFEKSLKSFSIQLAAFPFQMKLLGLFQFNRSMVFAIFGSTISHAIVLMQYDYKNSKN